MSRRTGLGRGLDALIPREETIPSDGVMRLSTGAIVTNPRQPRTQFNPERLAELADSIREHGILQPLVVRPGDGEGQYYLIAGERRLKAATLAGLETVPVIVRSAAELEQLELALIENVQREDLSALETAEAYRQLIQDFNLSQEEVAHRVGKSRVSVTNTLRLLNLPESVRKALSDGRISEGHARALLGLNTAAAQQAALDTVLRLELNVRQTEELVRKLSGERPEKTPRPAPPPEIQALEEQLRTRLGTRVTLHHSDRGGTLTIHYYSDEELDTLIAQLLES
ncbi:MAG TPA: ParB/RepB/Spo0J family partition protein [Anaerolineaceae bacterium]|nr:ParB/RepB/Spo0J family partition protein [Anaerolineaceae bacterium]